MKEFKEFAGVMAVCMIFVLICTFSVLLMCKWMGLS